MVKIVNAYTAAALQDLNATIRQLEAGNKELQRRLAFYEGINPIVRYEKWIDSIKEST